MRPERHNLTHTFLAVITLSAIFWVGADLRSIAPEHAILQSDRVDSYYFDKTHRLLDDGQFPQQDIWDFAPDAHPENAPPGLAYITALLYTPITLFSDITLYEFTHIFPVIIFGVWLMVIFLVFLHLYDLMVALFISALFAFLPVSVAFTTQDRYFEELVGVPLMFAGIYMLMRVARADHTSLRKWMIATAATISLLALSWQQFPLFFMGTALSIIFIAGLDIKKWKFLSLRWGIPIITGLIIAEFISRVLVDISYSVFGMLGEFFYAFLIRHDPNLILAMQRNDWANLSLQKFFNYFGWSGVIFGTLGIAAIAAQWKAWEKRITCAFAIVGILMLYIFIKDRYMALAFLLFLFAAGIDILFSPRALRDLFFRMLTQGHTWIHAIRSHITRKTMLISFLVTGSLLIIFLINFIYDYKNPPMSILSFTKEREWQVGVPQIVRIEIRNNGGKPAGGSAAFSGMHVEIINGFVSSIKASASSTHSSVVFKNFSQAGNAFFFETKFDTISPKSREYVSFVVTPYAEPIRILYRGWLPGRCGLFQRLEGLRDLRRSRKNFKNSWRNEECIQRVPVTDDLTQAVCRIPVFAAHEKLQNFRCFLAL